MIESIASAEEILLDILRAAEIGATRAEPKSPEPWDISQESSLKIIQDSEQRRNIVPVYGDDRSQFHSSASESEGTDVIRRGDFDIEELSIPGLPYTTGLMLYGLPHAQGPAMDLWRHGSNFEYGIVEGEAGRASRERLRQDNDNLRQENEILRQDIVLLQQENEILTQKFNLLLSGETDSEAEHLESFIFDTRTHDSVLDVLRSRNLGYYVEDYYTYLKYRKEDIEGDESPGIILQSLQSWAWFLIDYSEPNELPYVKITADYFGCVDLIWRLSPDSTSNDPDNEYYGPGKGLIVLRFLPSYLNYLSIMSGVLGNGMRRIAFDGYFSHNTTKSILNAFTERMLHVNKRPESW